jgi:hypothetical protein
VFNLLCLVVLRYMWRPTIIVTGRTKADVLVCKLLSQRTRGIVIIMVIFAAFLSFVLLDAIDRSHYYAYTFALPEMFRRNPLLGLLLQVSMYMPTIVLYAGILMGLRVLLTPSMVRGRVLRRNGRGRYMMKDFQDLDFKYSKVKADVVD